MQGFLKSCALALAVGLSAASAQAAEKVILDTDFNVLNDDGQAFIMLAQLHAQKRIDLLGMTLVTGNAWVDQEQVDALKAVESMGVEKEVECIPARPTRCCTTSPPSLRSRRCSAQVGPVRSRGRVRRRRVNWWHRRMVWRPTPNCAMKPPRSSSSTASSATPMK